MWRLILLPPHSFNTGQREISFPLINSLFGPGLTHGICDEPCEFTINTKDAGAGSTNSNWKLISWHHRHDFAGRYTLILQRQHYGVHQDAIILSLKLWKLNIFCSFRYFRTTWFSDGLYNLMKFKSLRSSGPREKTLSRNPDGPRLNV